MPLPRIVRVLAGVTAATCVLGASVAVATAASASTPSTAKHWQVLVGAQAHNEAIQTMAFYPRHLWVDQGDSVSFVANAAEIHTVTFLARTSPCPSGALCQLPPGGFDPGDPLQSTPQGSHRYDGKSYFSSGVLTSATGAHLALPPFVTLFNRYTLRFADDLRPGAYTYYCLVHGAMMSGEIIVQRKGTPYPFTQKQYDTRAAIGQSRDIADGMALWNGARKTAAQMNREHGPTVLVGAMDDRVMIMRFIPGRSQLSVGSRVHFVTTSMGEPHTVTFGSDETGCGSPPCSPTQPWNVRITKDGNERAAYPGHNGGFTGSSTALNSGIMLGLPPALTGAPSKLTLRMTAAGSYHYMCALHDYMGMVGTLAVRGA
jgi:plastocyanin